MQVSSGKSTGFVKIEQLAQHPHSDQLHATVASQRWRSARPWSAMAEVRRRLELAQVMCLDGAIETDELKRLNKPLKARRGGPAERLATAARAPSPVQLHPQAAEA